MARTQQKLVISPEEKMQLQLIVKKGKDWRERERAQTILDLAAGHKVKMIAEKLGIHEETVRVRRRKWNKEKLASLKEKERSGAPRKLNEHHRLYLAKRIEDTDCSKHLLSELDHKFGLRISTNTLTNTLKEMGYLRKTSRHRLYKKSRSNLTRKIIKKV